MYFVSLVAVAAALNMVVAVVQVVIKKLQDLQLYQEELILLL